MSNPTRTTTARSNGELTPAALEGVLAGHRRMIEILLAVAVEIRGASLLDDLEKRLGFEDHEEDPGVLPDAAFAAERAADAEVRRLLRSAREAVSSRASSSA